LTQGQKVAKVAQQFEAVMLQQILQETQKPVFQTEFTDNSTAASIYRSLVTKQLAEAISKSGNFGLAKMLTKQLSQQFHSASSSKANPAVDTTAVSPAKTSVIQSTMPNTLEQL